ncbi:MAG: Holliday junction branch migration protein RuvA [Chloroflexi bacterium]|nr:Holliday junction branch migration protein RuvA [Chloroflexota bacterium]
MIASIQGRIVSKHADHAIIVVGGVGFKVFAPFSTLERLTDDQGFLHTQLIVREDSLTLYGFATTAERDFFNLLININGVGPKIALAILSTLSLDNLRSAVLSERHEILTRVPGIGKKTAQKIALELKDKIPSGLDIAPGDIFDDLNTDVVDALVALGYSIVEAQSAVQALPKDAPKDIEARIRLALQFF